MSTPYRSMVAGLATMGPVTLRGHEYKGAYLATLVAMNPEQPAEESARTSQLISEMGRLTAAALKDNQMAEARYRAWRSEMVTLLTTDADACANLDLVPEGSGKTLSKTASDEALRQLPEYLEHQESISSAEETHGTLFAAYEAAKARQWAIRAFEASGGTDNNRTESAQSNHPVYDGGGNHYHGGHNEIPSGGGEELAASGTRTPLPPKPKGPPGPPPSRGGN